MKKNILLSVISILLTVSCFSQTPNYVWAKSAGVNGATANSVATDASGNVIVVGNFVGTNILFGTTTLTNAGSGNSSDIFVAKYDPDGNVLWAKKQTGGGTSTDEAQGVAADATGNVIVTGTFIGSNIIFGTTTLTNAGSGTSTDMFIVKYDPNGNVLWAKKQTAGGTAFDVAKGVVADPNGNVIVTGNFNSLSITFGTTTLTNAGANDIFTVKYDPNGNVLWAKQPGPGGSVNNDVPYRIAADAGGNVIITGNFQSPSITFGTTTLTNPMGTGATEIFIVKYNPNGNVLWAKQQDANGSANELGAGVAADPSGNIIVSGWFNSPTVTFGTTTLTNSQSPNSIDIFIVKYDCNGNVLWARQQDAGGTSNDNAINVTTDARGNVIVTGYFEGADITFGTTTLTNAGVRDFFIVKYDPNGNVSLAKQQDAGGTGADVGQCVTTDASGNVIVAGIYTAQTNPTINITFDTTTLGMPPENSVATPVNMFVAKLSGTEPAPNQPAPFNCDTTAYLFLDNPTRMYRLNLNSGVSQLVADPIISSPCNQGLNAFGFNPADNYIWGYRVNTNQIVRIASDYTVTIFSIPGLPIKPYNTGDVSENGIFYLYAGNDLDSEFYRIDLNLPSPQLMLPNLAIIPTLLADWAFSPIDGNLYSVAANTFELYRFDTLGNRTFLGMATGDGINAGSNYGGIFMDNFGNMYAINNANGNVFKIDQPHNGNTTATLFSQGPGSLTGSDGASNFTIQNAPLINITNDTTICENTSIQLNASASFGNILWQTDPTLSCTSCNDPIADPATPTTYFVTASANGCTSRDSVSVSLYISSLLALSSDTSICEGASTTLNSNSALQVNWTPTNDLSCATCTAAFATPSQTTTYVATADVGSCLLSDSVTISVDTSTPILFLNETIICANDILQLNAVADADDINWFPADYLSCDNCFNPVCTPPSDMTYLVTTQNVACPDSAFITIHTLPLPNVDAGNDTTIVEGQDLNLNASGAENFQWNVDATLSDFNIGNPNAKPSETTYYFVTGTDENGCQAIDSIQVSIKLLCNSIFVPNTFTPDDDGLNDVFLPSISGFDIVSYELKIWDRWGTLIFESLSPNEPWIGDVRKGESFAQDGTYVWKLSLKGECNQGTHQDFVGHLNLIR
jgi:gliding motility-associated-like protein